MHNAGVKAQSLAVAALFVLGWLVIVRGGTAQAQSGCEYVQQGPNAGDFYLDCGSHLPPGQAPNPNPDRYLAIALSPKNYAAGVASGASKTNAERTALAQCSAHRGIGCLVVESSLNMCTAIAISNPRKIIAVEKMPGQGWNPSELARRKCAASGGTNCATIVAGCANGYMSPTPWTPPTRGDGSYQAPTFRRR
jgi:hypothetical protein